MNEPMGLKYGKHFFSNEAYVMITNQRLWRSLGVTLFSNQGIEAILLGWE